MAQVGLEHLTKVFEGPDGQQVRAVDDACLVVEDKELLVLAGPSGCGKTTTLRLIAGLEDPTSGAIAINGRVVNDLPPKDRDVAMVFQDSALYPHMSVYENLSFGLMLRHVSRAEIALRVKEAAQLLGLSGCLDRKPPALSGGQRQRVALGRAMVRQPRLFLLDEPLSNLDAQTRLRLRAEIARLHTQLAATMLYVTHDQVEAMTLGHRVAVMKEGVIQQVADPITLYRHPANLFVAGFIGQPPMNFINGTLQARENALFFQEQSSNGPAAAKPLILRLDETRPPPLRPYAGKSVVFGIRPEDIACGLHQPQVEPGCAVQAVVEVVQALGSETWLHLAAHTHSFIARVRATDHFTGYQPVTLTFDMRQAHFFDPASGAVIA